MIPHGVEVFLAHEPIDLRWGFDRLAGIAREQLGRDPRGGALFVFFGKRKEALVVLFFDGTALCLFYRRLDRGVFRWPVDPGHSGAVVEIDDRVLDDLLDGIDVEPNPRVPPPPDRRAAGPRRGLGRANFGRCLASSLADARTTVYSTPAFNPEMPLRTHPLAPDTKVYQCLPR